MTEKLWAPWRMSYIADPTSGPLQAHERPCPFCNHRAKVSQEADRANLLLSRSPHTFTILNKFPYTNGHLMVMPYEHVGDFSSVPVELLKDWMEQIQRASRILKEELQPDGLNIGMNLGRSAGAGIPDHIHMHVVPRWNGDTNFMPVLDNTRVLPEYIEVTYDRLIGAFSK